MSTSKPSGNAPSLEEAERVVSFLVNDALAPIAAGVVRGTSTTDSLREYLALTIAVVGATEGMYQSLKPHPDQWDSLERSALVFMDEYVLKHVAAGDPELKRALTRHRRRKLDSKAGVLRLVESDRNKRSRWATVTLRPDAQLPIPEEAGDGLADAIQAAEERLYALLAAVPDPEPLVLAGQVVGVLCASEFLLALFPSNNVAALCVQVATSTTAAGQSKSR